MIKSIPLEQEYAGVDRYDLEKRQIKTHAAISCI